MAKCPDTLSACCKIYNGGGTCVAEHHKMSTNSGCLHALIRSDRAGGADPATEAPAEGDLRLVPLCGASTPTASS